jgi:5-methylcytosine-specific restriction enzyme A
MSRKQFMRSQGATCKNWIWSWSFVNERKRFVIFGAWDRLISGRSAKIFTKDWEYDAKGNVAKGYKQSLDHLRLIEKEGYKLYTFPMQPAEGTWQQDVIPKIKKFTPELTAKKLVRVGDEWFATEADSENALPEELASPEKFPEGAKISIVINAFERNPKARAACIAYHGCHCAASPRPISVIDYEWMNPRLAIRDRIFGSQFLFQLRTTYRGMCRLEELRELLKRDRIFDPFGVLLDNRIGNGVVE